MPRVTITVPEKKPQPYRFQLDRQTVRLGRGSENDIVIDCASVSVRHAEMERVPGGYRLRDLASTNGTKLDGTPKEVIELKNGLPVKLGDVAFDFQLSDEEISALDHEAPATPSPILREEDDDTESADRSPKSKTDIDESEDEKEDEDEDKEKALRKKRHGPKRPKQHYLGSSDQPSATASFVTTLLLCVLAIAAFVAGLAMRHNKETGRSLLLELISPKTPAHSTGTPDTQENPAPSGHE